jgi:hypothetical protein
MILDVKSAFDREEAETTTTTTYREVRVFFTIIMFSPKAFDDPTPVPLTIVREFTPDSVTNLECISKTYLAIICGLFLRRETFGNGIVVILVLVVCIVVIIIGFLREGQPLANMMITVVVAIMIIIVVISISLSFSPSGGRVIHQCWGAWFVTSSVVSSRSTYIVCWLLAAIPRVV